MRLRRHNTYFLGQGNTAPLIKLGALTQIKIPEIFILLLIFHLRFRVMASEKTSHDGAVILCYCIACSQSPGHVQPLACDREVDFYEITQL